MAEFLFVSVGDTDLSLQCHSGRQFHLGGLVGGCCDNEGKVTNFLLDRPK